jgi:sialate O-acetylesterase
MKISTLSFFLLISSRLLYANLVLPNVFGNNMVLQQKTQVKVWGWGKPGEPVNLNGNWDEQIYKTTVKNDGKWSLEVTTPAFGGPYEIIINGYNKINLTNVLIGEVWLVSGQSNMEWSANSGIDNANTEIAKANFPDIRFLNVNHNSAEFPQQNIEANWQNCTPETMKNFSAIGYFFAQKLNTNTLIPIGIINASWGGTPAEAWTPEKQIVANPVLYKDAISLKEVPWGPVKAGSIYNAMIAPLVPFKLKGCLWYQGESNVSNASNYDKLLSTLINSWRTQWAEELPFYYVQIAPYKYEKPEEGVTLRNAQRMAEKIPNTAMVVITDIGDINDIHPKNKKDVGVRLANVALKNLYSIEKEPIAGPKLLNYENQRGKLILYFDTILKCNRNCESSFEIADINGVFLPADVKIKSNTITLSNNKLIFPVFGRFAWGNTNETILTNESKLPASSFVTDNWWQFKNN